MIQKDKHRIRKRKTTKRVYNMKYGTASFPISFHNHSTENQVIQTETKSVISQRITNPDKPVTIV